MWENLVGRSRPFWDWVTQLDRQHFGPVMDGSTRARSTLR